MALKAKLDLWRKDLIDMSRNNGLLYYREESMRYTGVRLAVKDAAALYRAMTRESASKGAAKGDTFSLASLGIDLADEDNAALARRLARLRQRAREDLNERGIVTLYLVFGMLDWCEAEQSAEVIHSPLVMAPVALSSNGPQGELTLKRIVEQEVEINPTLRERLASSFRIQLPTYAELMEQLAPAAAEQPATDAPRRAASAAPPAPTLDAVLAALRTTLSALPPQLPWEINAHVHLGRFFFQKLVMRKDLETHEAEALTHPLLQRLGGEVVRVTEPRGIPANRLDEVLEPQRMLEVLDADSSQQEAIEAAKAGANFVLQGPPGTGKSQTIANIIAEVLGMGRSVLFVSEKMAALEVVRKRLGEVGLADFCLTLHDPRADKKTFIEELRTALRDVETTPGDEARWVRAAEDLANEREHLNHYVRELHTARFALGLSAFEVYGQLARLAAAPATDFTLPQVAQTTHVQFETMREAVRGLLDHHDALDDYATYPWRETLATDYTAALESSADDHLTALARALADAQAPLVAIRRGLAEDDAPSSTGSGAERAPEANGAAANASATPGGELATAITFGYARDAIARMREALTTPLPPRSWFAPDAVARLRPLLTGAVASGAAYQQNRDRIDPLYYPTVRSLDHAALLRALRETSEPTLKRLRTNAPGQSTQDIHDLALAQRAALDDGLAQAVATLRAVATDGAAVAEVCGLRAPITLNETEALLGLARCLLATPTPPKSWLEADTYAEARIVAQDADERYNACAQSRGALQARYAPPYFALDLLAPIAQRFHDHYQSITRFLRPQYYQDMARLRAFGIGDQPGQRRPRLEVETDLYQAVKLLEGEAWLSERRSDHARVLGRVFAGPATNWPQARTMLAWTDEFHATYGAYSAYDPAADGDAPGVGVVRLATGPAATREGLRTQEERLGAAWEQWRQWQAALQRLLRFDALPGVPYALGEAEPLALATALERQHAELRAYWAAVDTVIEKRVSHHSRSVPLWADICGDLVAAQGVHTFEAWLAEHEASLRESLGAGYKGNATDWAGQLTALTWVERLLSHYPDGKAPDALALLLSADGDEARRQSLRAAITQAQTQLNAIEGELQWTDTLLPRRALLATDEARDAATIEAAQAATSLAALRARVDGLREALPQLRRWLECAAQIHLCRRLGLGDLLERTLGQRPFPATIVEQFEQRFYRLWLDEVRRASDTLRMFSGSAHERIIARFQRNDEEHAHLARERLRGRLMEQRRYTRRWAQSARQPTYSSQAPGRAPNDPALSQALTDLQREVSKKRHSSIRTIVRNVTPALLELKPCWMMSPLTVSQFVASGQRLFDLVIFDEASQVSPEDAICAILRGKQLIVVGDTKQLPPTRFFSKTLADDEGDDDQDDDDEQQPTDDTARRESILKECLGILPERSLKWHYRSRHESLIAFSNHEFYDDDLITFPSPEARSADGVRFIHVAGAVYDRSRTRTNRQEAERVVDTLFEIVRKTPKRKIGVVALSSAQENAIRDALETRFKREPLARAWRDQLNEDSDASDAFFIKNLESVQGDERDVIILSVGYGHDRDGRPPSSFGPIDRAGGERRLNVAVTRARYQMIVVSSLRAEDVPLTASLGRRALRRYLDYAARGTAALADDPLAVRSGAGTTRTFDSPFEMAVYSALTARGLRLDTQVGCSGYRIDLAVRDPENPDVYLLGIECDGASYHSARTARDRDRLRQRCLEGLGWRIHRIWSSDWFRDPAHEIARTVDAVDAARQARDGAQSATNAS